MDVKILVSYHKPSLLLKNDIMLPIHAGRSVARHPSKDGAISDSSYNWLIENMIGDDTGDNISAKNRFYNEVTSIYWAWKNAAKLDNPDYIGFTQKADMDIMNKIGLCFFLIFSKIR